MNEIRIPAKFLEQYVSGDWHGSQMMIPVQLHGIDINIVLPRVVPMSPTPGSAE